VEIEFKIQTSVIIQTNIFSKLGIITIQITKQSEEQRKDGAKFDDGFVYSFIHLTSFEVKERRKRLYCVVSFYHHHA
jgi:hypothetical protein